MSNINIMAAPGQLNGQGLTDAQFLKIFTGEILTAFDETNVMKGLHRERTITHGKRPTFRPCGRPLILGNNKIMHG